MIVIQHMQEQSQLVPHVIRWILQSSRVLLTILRFSSWELLGIMDLSLSTMLGVDLPDGEVLDGGKTIP
jgi:hypothetical protein